MKKLLIAFVMLFVLVGSMFAAGGAYISKITADSLGMTIDSKGDVYIKAGGKITLAPKTSSNLNSTTSISMAATTTVSLTSGTTETITSGTTQSITSGTTQAVSSGTTQALTAGTTQTISAAVGQMISCNANNITITATAGDVKILAPGTGQNAFYQMVSGAAAASLPANKIVLGYTAAKADGINVTLTAGSTFTNAWSYWVFVTEYSATSAQPTLGTKVTKIDGSHFTVSGDASSTYQYMCVGQ